MQIVNLNNEAKEVSILREDAKIQAIIPKGRSQFRIGDRLVDNNDNKIRATYPKSAQDDPVADTKETVANKETKEEEKKSSFPPKKNRR